MTRFMDGPAEGRVLMLKRAPLFLRAVRKRTLIEGQGEWDALDQLTDTPEPDEEIIAYRRHRRPGWVHINTGRKPGGGFYTVAEYRVVPAQPDDATLRDRARWQAWVLDNLGHAGRQSPTDAGSCP